MRKPLALALFVLLFLPLAASAQLSTAVELCGTVSAFVQPTSTQAGAITISGRNLVVAAGTTITNSDLLGVGSNVCIRAQLNASGQLSSPITVTANTITVVDACGVVSAFVRPTATAQGLIMLGNRTFPIAANTEINHADLIRVGANVCLRATLNGLGQVTAPSMVAANATSTLSLCGVVGAFTNATSSAAGALTIDGRRLTIAAGTLITNAGQIVAGANLCLNATLNAFGEIIAPSSVTAGASGAVEICGVVSAYTAATASTPGSITIAGRRIDIAAGTTISGEGLIVAGASLCLEAQLTATGSITAPATVVADISGVIEICGTVSAFQSATATVPGSITIGGQTRTIAIGTEISGSESLRIGATLCLKATINTRGEIIPPSSILPNRPPEIAVPGPQTVQAGSRLTFSVSATDPDVGDSVSLSARNAPANSDFSPIHGNPARGVFTFAPTSSQANQTFTVIFRATDSRGASVTDEVEIRVTAGATGGGNRPPQLHLPGPQTVQVGTTLTFTLFATDPDPESVQLTVRDLPPGATGTPSPASGNPATMTIRFTPTENQRNETFLLTFTARDPKDATDSGTVLVRVGVDQPPTTTPPNLPNPPTCANRPPIVSGPRSLVIEVGQELRFRVMAVDPEGDGVLLSTSELPPGVFFDSISGEITFTPGPSSCEAVAQPITVTFTATDHRGGSTTFPVRILVVGRNDEGSNPPVLSAPFGPIITRTGERIEFAIAGLAQERGCSLTLGAQPLANSSLDPVNGRFSFTAAASLEGKTVNAVFVGRDCRGSVSTITVPIAVARGTEGRLGIGMNRVVFEPGVPASMGGFVTVPIVNHGAGWLRVDSATLSQGIDFQIEGAENLPLLLPPGGSIDLRVTYQPRRNGPVSDVLTIRTSDSARPEVTIHIDANTNRRRSTSQ